MHRKDTSKIMQDMLQQSLNVTLRLQHDNIINFIVRYDGDGVRCTPCYLRIELEIRSFLRVK
jgi:hypothetical protein